MQYRPSLPANVLYGMRILAWPAAITAAVLWAGWSCVVQSLLLGAIGVSLVCSFPRHHFFYTLETSDEGFEYLPWVGRKRSVRWADVTDCRLTWVWLRLVRDDGRVHFLFERPLLVQNRAAFLNELRRRCPAAARLGWIGWWRLVWRGMKEATR